VRQQQTLGLTRVILMEQGVGYFLSDLSGITGNQRARTLFKWLSTEVVDKIVLFVFILVLGVA
jgi:hypothetical protein